MRDFARKSAPAVTGLGPVEILGTPLMAMAVLSDIAVFPHNFRIAQPGAIRRS
jgi:hypothetical protein